MYCYRNIINNHLKPKLGKTKLQDITPTSINRYFTSKKKDLSNNTLRKHYNLLKDALDCAVNEDKILKNPMDKVTLIKSIKYEVNFYNVEQLKTLLTIAQGDRMDKEIY